VNYLLSVSCKQEDIGALHGTVDSMRAVCRAIAPMIGGCLIQYVNNSSPWLVACCACACGTSLLALYVALMRFDDHDTL